MVYTMRSNVLAILFLCLCIINLTVADPRGLNVLQRDGQSQSASPTVTDTPSPTNQPQSSGDGNKNDAPAANSGSADPSPSPSPSPPSNSTSSSISHTPTLVPVSAITSNINGAMPTSSSNASSFNSTLTPNELPIQPQITPGFAVAGVFLMISGAIYTLVGIKNKWLHIFLSAAYLASIAVTVLILYVMNPPVSNAVEGAYVVAIVMTGLILGGAAIVFTEMTEGLGCLLGGFCLSMWLLILKPGGLLTTVSGKSIFIACFTLVAFSTSFSHYTRPYSLIISISFSGATAVVMGIDCFSRAGLKEFWAYLWALNSNLFPLGATSYPLTRGIRVEIAAVIVIFLAGIVSQMKLWKVIKERREQRASERLQDERNMEQEEENVGRRVEHATAEDREQWEAVYGDKDVTKPTHRDSGLGDMDSQKKGATSTVTSGEDDIEMSEMPSPTLTNGMGLVMKGHEGGPITVRVARDLEVPQELDEEGNPVDPSNRKSYLSNRSSLQTKQEEQNVWVLGADGEARLERRPSQRNSKRVSNPPVSPAPNIVPLPFKVPEEMMGDDRSSVATFADEDQDQALQRRQSKRQSASGLLRRVSQRHSQRHSFPNGASTEDLVIPRGVEDDRSSIAATMDGLSDDEDLRSIRSSVNHAPDTSEAIKSPMEPNFVPGSDAKEKEPEVAEKLNSEVIVPGADTSAATKADDPELAEDENDEEKTEKAIEESVQQSLTSSTNPKPEAESTSNETSGEVEKPNKGTSAVSAIDSKPASITKDRLPPQLSKVVMSYRTNEWAKHLSNADAPEFEELKLAEYPSESQPMVSEVAAPVNVEELQQTPENATPAPASRATSQISYFPPTRSNSALSKYTLESQLQDNGPVRSMSQQGQSSQQSFNKNFGIRNSSAPAIPQPIVESPTETDFPFNSSPHIPQTNKSTSPNVPFGTTNTLIGKRENMVRSKTMLYTNPSLPSTPEVPLNSASEHLRYAHSSPYASGPVSRAESDAGSIYNQQTYASPIPDDDNISLSARRELIRQSSLQQLSAPIPPHIQTTLPYDSHQPRRSSTGPSPEAREQQLASWRASVQHDLQSAVVPKVSIDRQRSALWQERQQEDQRKAMEERRARERDAMFNERMRRGDMLDAHREALRKMQASANRHAS